MQFKLYMPVISPITKENSNENRLFKIYIPVICMRFNNKSKYDSNYIRWLFALNPIRKANTRSQIIYVVYLYEIQIRKANTKGQVVNFPNENFKCSKLEDDKFLLFILSTTKLFFIEGPSQMFLQQQKSGEGQIFLSWNSIHLLSNKVNISFNIFYQNINEWFQEYENMRTSKEVLLVLTKGYWKYHVQIWNLFYWFRK